MKHLPVLEGTVAVRKRLKPVVALSFLSTLHQTHLVSFEHWLKKIGATVVEDVLELVEAGVVEETVVGEVSLINLDRASLIAHHELLEGQEAQVPTVTLLVRYEL